MSDSDVNRFPEAIVSQLTFRAGYMLECLVGWDPPLETFFGQVYKVDEKGERVDPEDDEDDPVIHWVGTTQSEISTVDDLEVRLKPHVQMIPKSIREKLNLFVTNRAVPRMPIGGAPEDEIA